MTLVALVFTVASLHLNDSRDYNQFNPGMGLEWSTGGKTFVTAGAYLNSSARLSVYTSVGRQLIGPFGIEAGAITGYSVPVLPVAFPYMLLSFGGWDLKVNVLPVKRPIVGIQVRYRR